MNVEAGLQLGDIKGIARRRAKVALATWLVFSLAAYWVAMALPNEYESAATVLVEPQSVDPDLVKAGIPESDINRRLGLMAARIMSRPRLSRIIDDLGLYAEEAAYIERAALVEMMRDHIAVDPVIPVMEKDRIVLQSNIKIDQFKISFRNHDPLIAKKVADRLANDFIEDHIAGRVDTSQKSLEFLDNELKRLVGAITAVEEQIGDVKSANAGRLPEDIDVTQRQMERLLFAISEANREVSNARSDEAFFRSQVITARESGLGSVHERRSDQETPQNRLESLKLAKVEMESRGLTTKHPDMIRINAEIENLKREVDASKAEAQPSSFAELNARAEAERATLRREHAEAELQRLKEKELELSQMLGSTPEVAEQLGDLEREYQHLFAAYQDFSKRRQQASVQADLERRQLGEQFRVLEQAVVAAEPSAPNRVVIILVGIVCGLVIGIGVGVVSEIADPAIHDVRQLQNTIQLPVLATIPEIWLEADRLRQRNDVVRQAVAAVVLSVFALVGGAANYAWVNGGGGGKAARDESEAAAVAKPAPKPGELTVLEGEGEAEAEGLPEP